MNNQQPPDERYQMAQNAYQQHQQGPAYSGATYPQPPKKKHTLRNVLIVVSVLFVLGVGGCVAFVGAVGNEVAKDLDAQAEKNAPRAVTVGKAFTIARHETLAGWKVQNAAGSFDVAGSVKNISDETSTAFVQFKFLSATGEVLGNVSCNSADLEPGQSQKLNCVPDGTFGKYAKVTAEATF